MEAPLDALLNRSNSEKQRTGNTSAKTPAATSLQQGLRASVQKQQVIVPSCSTGRSGSFNKVPDNSSSIKKNLAPIAVVLSKDKRVTGNPNLFLSPFIFLPNDKAQSKKTSTSSSSTQSKTPQAQPEKRSSLVAKKNDLRKFAASKLSSSSSQNSNIEISPRESADFRNERDSSIEAEDSLGTLLSKHFEVENSEDHATSPSSEIAKRRLLHERARIRHICSVCNRECPSKHKLKRHLSTHSEDRPFACQACGKTFKWTGYLQKHIRQQHSNCIDLCPTSPLISPASGQSQMTPDTPTFSTSFTSSPSSPSQTHTLTKNTPTHSHNHKKRNKSSRKKSLSNGTEAFTLSKCPLHIKKSRSAKNVAVEVIDTSEDCKSVESLIVSIPKMHTQGNGVNTDQLDQLDKCSEPEEVDPLDATLENINASRSPLPGGITAKFSTEVSAIMAEPVPSCVQSNSTVNMHGMMNSGTEAAVGTSMNRSQGFEQGCQQYCFSMDSTSSNSTDMFLSQDYDHSQLLSTNTQSSLSTYSMQQDQSAPHTQSDTSMSNPIQIKDSMTFPVQDNQSSVDPLSQAPNQVSFSSSLQPPDLIPVTSQFDPLASNLQFEQQLNNMMNFGCLDTLSNHCSMQYGGNTGQTLDGDSLLDDLSVSGLGYISPADLGMFDSFMSPPSYMGLHQARQLFYENSQQMRRILRSYQTLQNTLLRVTAGAMLSTGSMYNGVLDDGGLAQPQQLSMSADQQMNSQVQLNGNISHLQMPVSQSSQSGDHMTQLQHHIHVPQDHMTQLQDQPHDQVPSHVTQTQDTDLMESFLSQTTQLSSSMTTSAQPAKPPSPTAKVLTDIFDSSSQLTCEPDDLLTPIINRDDPSDSELFPVEKRARLDNDSLYDVGIQCELGPETLVALKEEEQQRDGDEEDSSQYDGLEEILTNVNLLSTSDLSNSFAEVKKQDASQALSVSATPEAGTPAEQVDLSESNPATPDQDSSDPSRIVNKYRCGAEGCGKAYMHRKDLTRHIKIRHGAYVMPKMLKPVAVETTEKPYICSMLSCGRSYHHMRDLRRHQRNCHDEHSKSQANSPANPKKDQTREYNSIFGKIQLRFPCDYPGCVRSYVHKKDLVRHKRLYHKDSSTKPTVPVPMPYSDTDLRFIRHEVKQEVEQLMKKGRFESSGSTCSSAASITGSDSDTPSPDALSSSLNTDVFLSLGLAPPPLESDKNASDGMITKNTAQIISLIQNLTTSTSQVGEIQIPQFPLPITVPVIPVVADAQLNGKTPVFTLPCSPSEIASGESSSEKLKQALSKPGKNSAPSTANETSEKCEDTKTADVIPSPAEPSSDSINNILDISAQELVDSLKPQTQDQKGTKRSPDTLANLAAAVLSMPESELSDVLIKTVSSSPGLCPSAAHTSGPVVTASLSETTEHIEPLCCASDIGVLPELIEETLVSDCPPDTGKNLMDAVLAFELMGDTQQHSHQVTLSKGDAISAIVT